MDPLPVPTTLDDALSPAWLTAVLAIRFPGIEVRHVTPGPIVSRLSTNVRFRIECAGELPDGLPADLCIKGYFSEFGEQAHRAGVPEASFYRDLAGRTKVRTLRSVYADVDPTTLASVVVSEDVIAQGGVFLDPQSSYNPDLAAESLEQLAILHASTWGEPSVAHLPWLAPSLGAIARGRGVTEIRGNFEGPIGAGVPVSVRDASRLYDAFVAVAADAATASPWAVLHADPHLANLFLAGDGRPGFVDWQLVQRGPWYQDVGYHLASVLSVDDRRRSERDLVRHYLDRLAAGGVDAPTEDQAWAQLGRGFIHGFFLWGITLRVDPSITTALLERLGTATEDHGALERLPRG